MGRSRVTKQSHSAGPFRATSPSIFTKPSSFTKPSGIA
jgi:hypothetical protein